MSSKFRSNLCISAGQMVTGKWSGNRYKFKRLLGQGANGQVYEVESEGQVYALKIGFSPIDLQSEINHLQQLTKTQGSLLESYFILADDGELNGEWFPFYIMRYIQGRKLTPSMVSSLSPVERYGIGKQILQWIGFIHKQGYAFGDLKSENILITNKNKVYLIDFGGVTPLGSSVKEFTDVFDRGYWGAGERRADTAYDLFAFAMIWIRLLSNHSLTNPSHSLSDLYDIIHKNEELYGFSLFLGHLLQGKVKDTEEAQKGWREAFIRNTSTPRNSDFPITGRWIACLFAFSSMLCAVTLWWAWGGL